MSEKMFKPPMRPMEDQPFDTDFFTSIYEAVNSLNASEINYVVDTWAAPWDSSANLSTFNSEISNTGLQMKIASGIIQVNDGNAQNKVGQRSFTVQFPASSSFTAPPVVVCTPVFNGNNAEPVATCIQWVNTKEFYVHMQSIDSGQIKVSHINYAAFGF